MTQQPETPAKPQEAEAGTEEKQVSVKRGVPLMLEEAWAPLNRLRGDMDRLFDDFVAHIGFPFSGRARELEPMRRFERLFGSAFPSADLVDKGDAFEFNAELPGMERDDVEVSVSDGLLRIKGEKKEETEEKKGQYFFSERRFGSFQRSFHLPPNIDEDHIQASFKKGVLTVRLPKVATEAPGGRKIDIQSE